MLSDGGDWKRETWHRETGQRGTISQGWTSRNLFQCPSTKAHYEFMFDSKSIIWAAHRFYVCSSISFCFTYCYVRQTKLTSSLDNVWAHYKIVIVWLTDRYISKSFLCHHCVVLYTVYVFYVRTAPVRSQQVAPRCTLCNSRSRLLPRLPLPILAPPKLALLAQAPTCSCLRHRCCWCCCCCRPTAVRT